MERDDEFDDRLSTPLPPDLKDSRRNKAGAERVSDIRVLSLQTYEFARHVWRRQTETSDRLELTIKIERGGPLANSRPALDASIERIGSKIDTLAERIDAAASPAP